MYYLLLSVAYLLSLLPFGFLYGLSSVLNFIIFNIVGYRKKVVLTNIRNSFPDKTEIEVNAIAKKFYLSFSDQWVETLKLMSMSTKQFEKRVIGNWKFFDRYDAESRNVYVVLGHRFNWEWANVAFSLNSPMMFVGLYLPLSSKAFDRLMLSIRTRFGATFIPTTNLLPGLKKLGNRHYVMGFAADQTPSNMNLAIWYDFLNQPAPFITGPEKAAKRANAAVVYAAIKKIKRGHYQIVIEEICANAKDTPYGFVTKATTQCLQKEILEQPENWLWSHRRWKRKPSGEEKILEL